MSGRDPVPAKAGSGNDDCERVGGKVESDPTFPKLDLCICYIYHDTCEFSTIRRKPGNMTLNTKLMRAEYDFSKGKRGAAIPEKGKTRISIFIDNALLDAFRARAEKAGTGYQTMINEALRQYFSESEPPVTETILRHVLREEIPEYFSGAAPEAGGRAPRARKRRST